jgi:uncharacterized protein
LTKVGTIESLWRYPVKGMAGEELNEAFVGFAGFYGDRCYAFKNSASRKGFPYLSATGQSQMLRYKPRFRYPELAGKPTNLAEAMAISPGVTYANAEAGDLLVDVLTPGGEVLSIDDPRLCEMLCEGLRGENNLSLVRSDRAMTDCRPVSLISLQTCSQLEAEIDLPVDKRRFRANVYLDLESNKGFDEDRLVGKQVRLGPNAVIAVLERDPRCKAISLDPDSGEHNPEYLRRVAQDHATYAGVYCAVLVEGLVSAGDSIEVLE